MKLFKKKETLIENITFMSLMAAINVIFVLLASWIPGLLFIFVFILPLTSTVITYCCKKRYFIIYAVSTVGLCCLFTMWDIGNTLFYVIPSIISGFIFGLLIDKKVDPIWIIICASIINFAASYTFIPLIQLIYNRDIVMDFATIFHLQNWQYIKYLKHVVILLLALIQQTISYCVCYSLFPKLNMEIETKNDSIILHLITIISCMSLSVLFIFICKEFIYSFLVIAVFVTIHLIILILLNSNKWIKISLLISLFLGTVIYACITPLIKQATTEPLEFLSLYIFSVLILIIAFVNKYLLNKNLEYKIK